MNFTSRQLGTLLEDAVAISNVFHADPRYAKFYEQQATRLSGFPGIWKFIARASQVFNWANGRLEEEDGVANDCWIEAVDAYCNVLYNWCSNGEDVPNDKQLEVIADNAVRGVYGLPKRSKPSKKK